MKINRLCIILAVCMGMFGFGCEDNTITKNTCGNGVLDKDETCDGDLFAQGSKTCTDVLGNKSWKEGSTLSCRQDCTLELGACETECPAGECTETHCENNTLVTCSDDGRVDQRVDCKDQLCSARYKKCVDCVDNEFRCTTKDIETTQIEVSQKCVEGAWVEDKECTGDNGSVCDASVGQCKECLNGALRCNTDGGANQAQLCSANQWLVLDDCKAKTDSLCNTDLSGSAIKHKDYACSMHIDGVPRCYEKCTANYCETHIFKYTSQQNLYGTWSTVLQQCDAEGFVTPVCCDNPDSLNQTNMCTSTEHAKCEYVVN